MKPTAHRCDIRRYRAERHVCKEFNRMQTEHLRRIGHHATDVRRSRRERGEDAH